ncbi:hypothetical protein LguiA_029213 [Lonicera macranthoides]
MENAEIQKLSAAVFQLQRDVNLNEERWANLMQQRNELHRAQANLIQQQNEQHRAQANLMQQQNEEHRAYVNLIQQQNEQRRANVEVLRLMKEELLKSEILLPTEGPTSRKIHDNRPKMLIWNLEDPFRRIIFCSLSLLAGLLILLRSATRITHKARAVTCLAAKWHACATIDSFDAGDGETPMARVAGNQIFPVSSDGSSGADDVGDKEDKLDNSKMVPAYTYTAQGVINNTTATYMILFTAPIAQEIPTCLSKQPEDQGQFYPEYGELTGCDEDQGQHYERTGAMAYDAQMAPDPEPKLRNIDLRKEVESLRRENRSLSVSANSLIA